MILTCPACATRYQADTAMIALPGRTVRCAKCAHVWFQAPPEAEVEPEPELAPPVHVPEPMPQPAPRPMASSISVADDETFEEPPAHEPASPGASRRFAALGGWALLIVLVAAVAYAGIQYRQTVASLWPKSATLYATLGSPVNVLGLDLRGVHPDQEFEDGQPVLEVVGDVANVSDHKIPVPQIRVALIDAESREVYHWTFDPGAGTLAPGASHAFVTRLTAPPQEAKTISVRFAEAGEQ